MGRYKMDALFTKNVKDNIKKDLKVDKINEALSAQTKQFSINTDLLSNDNIQNHFTLYQGYVNNFNKVSAKLDTVNKAESNSNHSEFRSLKLPI